MRDPFSSSCSSGSVSRTPPMTTSSSASGGSSFASMRRRVRARPVATATGIPPSDPLLVVSGVLKSGCASSHNMATRAGVDAARRLSAGRRRGLASTDRSRVAPPSDSPRARSRRRDQHNVRAPCRDASSRRTPSLPQAVSAACWNADVDAHVRQRLSESRHRPSSRGPSRGPSARTVALQAQREAVAATAACPADLPESAATRTQRTHSDNRRSHRGCECGCFA